MRTDVGTNYTLVVKIVFSQIDCYSKERSEMLSHNINQDPSETKLKGQLDCNRSVI